MAYKFQLLFEGDEHVKDHLPLKPFNKKRIIVEIEDDEPSAWLQHDTDELQELFNNFLKALGYYISEEKEEEE